jgi:ATP-dependent protease ClpP protease subunit
MVYGGIQSGDEVEIRTLFDGQEEEYQIIINSQGGSGLVCMSIVNHIKSLKDMGKKVTTEVSGYAASAAAIIWLMGDVRIAHATDIIMFHGVQMLNAETGNKIPRSEWDEGSKLIVDTLNNFMKEELTKMIGAKQADKAIKGELWLTGKQAYKLGLATILK